MDCLSQAVTETTRLCHHLRNYIITTFDLRMVSLYFCI